MDDTSPSTAALQAHLVRGVIDATAAPDETTADARMRATVIAQAFHALAPADMMEAMAACNIISLQYLYDDALRALSDEGGDEKARSRLRSQANTLSRTLRQWLVRHETIQARREKRAAEDRETTRAMDPPPIPAPRAAANGAVANGAVAGNAAAHVRAPERQPPLSPAAGRPSARQHPAVQDAISGRGINGGGINGRGIDRSAITGRATTGGATNGHATNGRAIGGTAISGRAMEAAMALSAGLGGG